MAWRILVVAGGVGVATLGIALLAAAVDWLGSGQGVGRVALHVGLAAAGVALFVRGLAFRRGGQRRQAALAMGLLVAVTLPYAAVLATAVYLFALAGERF
ncbi:hypothetical protein [Roseomonas sp. CECT 9278]|uniref:hypothetical protein n=1 Tax=Roseomonas sp. CECT 9278 TaxID=2845823 RepID=UPI001E61DDFD|nr:hypothetical protein [Roseomonas sp. CECT 9278]CAH0137067.1 hypothetical protein ROS9278_00381 [Roseomonas sp. CECT 9278]